MNVSKEGLRNRRDKALIGGAQSTTTTSSDDAARKTAISSKSNATTSTTTNIHDTQSDEISDKQAEDFDFWAFSWSEFFRLLLRTVAILIIFTGLHLAVKKVFMDTFTGENISILSDQVCGVVMPFFFFRKKLFPLRFDTHDV
jgi:hypothetical protein